MCSHGIRDLDMCTILWRIYIGLLFTSFLASVCVCQITLPWSCNFEYDDCGFQRDPAGSSEGYSWTKISGTTPSNHTGPPKDSGHGQYMYMEATEHQPNETVCMYSPLLPGRSQDVCLSFAYNVHGQHVGRLQVIFYRSNGPSVSSFDYIGEHIRNKFLTAWQKEDKLNIPPDVLYIGFKAFRGGTWVGEPYGDISIDDIFIDNKPCPNTGAPIVEKPKWPTRQEEYYLPQLFDPAYDNLPQNPNCPVAKTNQKCNFDGAVELTFGCGMYNAGEASWFVGSGRTPTENTGPDYDSTTGLLTGKYLYMEADTQNVGTYAVLRSPRLDRLGGPFCLEFAYYMLGDAIGQLKVVAISAQGAKEVFQKIGNQGDGWKKARLTIEEGTLYFFIEASRGNSGANQFPSGEIRGDIAIDDVMLSYSTCKLIYEDCALTQPTDNSMAVGQPGTQVNCTAAIFGAGLCDLRNLNPEFLWVRHRSNTPSQNTGPNVDNTYKTNTGYYMYTEVSGIPGGEQAIFRTVQFPGSGVYCVSFYYHMYGAHMGDLQVYAQLKTGNQELMFHISGAQRWSPSGWIRQEKTSPQDTDYLVFIGEKRPGTKASDGEGDMAIDDLMVVSGACEDDSVTTPQPPEATGTPWPQNHGNPEIPKESIQPGGYPQCPVVRKLQVCNFDGATILGGHCLFYNDPNSAARWLHNSGPTSTPNTGPSADLMGSGKYLYMDATGQVPGTEARLISPNLQPFGGPFCLRFYYYMYGSGIGKLTVKESVYNQLRVLFEEYGQKADNWTFVERTVSEGRTGVQIVAQRGSTEYGDIAIDNIELLYGSCEGIQNCGSAQPRQEPSKPGAITSCSAENIVACNLVVDDQSPFLWLHNVGPTPTLYTGPTVDHTYGDASGSYMYTESSMVEQGEKAFFSTPTFPLSGQPFCVTFWYHMFGQTMGTLRVHAENIFNLQSEIFSKTGHIDNQWHLVEITLNSNTRKLIFEGETRYDNSLSDMAVDDLMVVQGPCEGSEPPTTPKVPPAPKAATTLKTPTGTFKLTTGFEGCEMEPIKLQCNFDGLGDSRCNFQSPQSLWQRSSNLLNTQVVKGMYWYVPSSVLNGGIQATLISPPITTMVSTNEVFETYAVSFYFYMVGAGNVLSLWQKKRQGQYQQVWVTQDSAAEAFKTISLDKDIENFMFVAQTSNPNNGGEMAMDEVAVRTCPARGSEIQEGKSCTHPCEGQNCEHKCIIPENSAYKPYCECLKGYKAKKEKPNECEDVNECVDGIDGQPACNQPLRCVNAIGSFVCVEGKCQKRKK